MPASRPPHPPALSPQSTIKLPRLFAVTQPFFLILPSLLIKDRDLLKTRMKITALYQHDVGSFSVSLGRFAAINLLAAIEPTSLCNQAELALAKRTSTESKDPALPEIGNVDN